MFVPPSHCNPQCQRTRNRRFSAIASGHRVATRTRRSA